MLRPSRAASTAGVPSGASIGTSKSVAERFVNRFASKVASSEMTRRSPYDVPDGTRSKTRLPRGPTARAATTTPRQSTKTAKAGWAACTAWARVKVPRRAAQTTSTMAAAPETQNGSTPNGEAAREPHEHQGDGHHGHSRDRGSLRNRVLGAGRLASSSRRKSSLAARYSIASTTTRTGAMTEANPRNVRSRCRIASRLVRLETGSSSEAELAIRRQAWAPGGAETPAEAAAASDDRRQQHDGRVEGEHGGHQGREQEHAGEQRDGTVTAETAYAAGRGHEHAGAAADVGDDEDRDQEEHDGSEVPDLVCERIEAERARGQGGRQRGEADRRLGAAARVHVGGDQQDQERQRRHGVGEMRHRHNLGHL